MPQVWHFVGCCRPQLATRQWWLHAAEDTTAGSIECWGSTERIADPTQGRGLTSPAQHAVYRYPEKSFQHRLFRTGCCNWAAAATALYQGRKLKNQPPCGVVETEEVEALFISTQRLPTEERTGQRGKETSGTKVLLTDRGACQSHADRRYISESCLAGIADINFSHIAPAPQFCSTGQPGWRRVTDTLHGDCTDIAGFR